MTATTPQAIAYTERDDRGYRPRPSAFVHIERGQGVTDQSRRFTLCPGGNVADLLRACPPGVVPIWLCGALPQDHGQDDGETDQDDLDDLPGDWTTLHPDPLVLRRSRPRLDAGPRPQALHRH